MLPKPYRLPAHKIRKTLLLGTLKRGQLVNLRLLPHPRNKLTRLAITIPLKIDKRATLRNRLKRVLGEIFRTTPAWLNLGVDLVVIAQAKAVSAKTAEFKQELTDLLLGK